MIIVDKTKLTFSQNALRHDRFMKTKALSLCCFMSISLNVNANPLTEDPSPPFTIKTTPLALKQTANTLESNRLIVKLKEDTTTETGEELASRWANESGLSLNYVRNLSFNNARIFEVADTNQVQAAISDIEKRADVEWVEQDKFVQPNFTPNDELFEFMWHLNDPVTGIQVENAWDIATGEGVIVAVIDTGFTNHVDLQDNLISQGFDFISDPFIAVDGDGRDDNAFDEGDADPNNVCGTGANNQSSWHGSHVSGTISALTDNDIGVAGVAFNAQILPVRALGRCGGLSSDIADAIVWSSGGSIDGVPDNPTPAQVINLSLGGNGPCSRVSQDAVDTARANGSTLVIAAGNSAADVENFDPASCDGVVSVAATDRQGDRAFYSNFGDEVDLAAPGGDTTVNNGLDGVLSTVNGGTIEPEEGNDIFVFFQGTSMAAPHVAGVAALLYELDPNLSPDEVEEILTDSTSAFPGTCDECGEGLLNAQAAVELLAEGNNLGDEDAENNEVESEDVTAQFEFSADTFFNTDQADFSIDNTVDDTLVLTLGGVDEEDIENISGGFVFNFTLDEDTSVALQFEANMTLSADYEADDQSQLLMSLDGELIADEDEEALAVLNGDGNGGDEDSTGDLSISSNLGVLEAGDHQIIIGGFNNEKTQTSEETTITLQNIQLDTSGNAPEESSISIEN